MSKLFIDWCSRFSQNKVIHQTPHSDQCDAKSNFFINTAELWAKKATLEITTAVNLYFFPSLVNPTEVSNPIFFFTEYLSQIPLSSALNIDANANSSCWRYSLFHLQWILTRTTRAAFYTTESVASGRCPCSSSTLNFRIERFLIPLRLLPATSTLEHMFFLLPHDPVMHVNARFLRPLLLAEKFFATANASQMHVYARGQYGGSSRRSHPAQKNKIKKASSYSYPVETW